MKEYTTISRVFHDKVSLVERADLINSDNKNAAVKQLLENDLVLKARLEQCLGDNPEYGDSKELKITFDSGDAAPANAWTDVEVMQSKETHKSLFGKISTMFKNVRYLYKLLGTTDISKFGGGTVTGAIKDLEDSKPGTVSKTKNGLVPQLPDETSTAKYLRQDGTWAVPPDNNTTYSNFVKSGTGAKAGLVPSPGTTAGTAKYLREDGTWQVPPDTKATITQSAAVTEAGKMALDAVEKNASIEGTLANGISQLNGKMYTKVPVNFGARWGREITNNQSFVFGNLLFVDYYVDQFQFNQASVELNATYWDGRATKTIGNVICVDESDEIYKYYPIATVDDGENHLTIGYYPNMEAYTPVKNAHIVGVVPIIPRYGT